MTYMRQVTVDLPTGKLSANEAPMTVDTPHETPDKTEGKIAFPSGEEWG